MKHFTSKKQKIGEKGENICVAWLNNNNYKVIERNFSTKNGEIDVIAKKNNILHFIEVKSVSYETSGCFLKQSIYNPLQNITPKKIAKLQKTMIDYISINQVSHETQIDAFGIYIDRKNVKHKIEIIMNIF